MRPRAQLNLVRPVQFTRTRPSSENCRCGPCLFSRLRSLAGSAGILLIVATFGPPLHYRPATLFRRPARRKRLRSWHRHRGAGDDRHEFFRVLEFMCNTIITSKGFGLEMRSWSKWLS